MKIDKYIEQLAQEMELEGGLPSPMPGIYTLSLDDLIITIADKSPGFSLSCNVAAVPQVNQEGFFTRMMLGNLFGQGTKGAVLGISEDGNLLTLSLVIEYNAEYKEFRDILEDFINTIDVWLEETASFSLKAK